MPDVFALIAAERRRTADLLDRLTPEQWAAPSLCEGWTTREVAAHLVMPFCVSTPQFIVRMIRAGFSLDKVSNRFATQETRSNAELAALLRANAEHRFTPPGLGPEAPLTDITVHTQDICRPLGIDHPVPAEVSSIVLDFVTSSKAARGFVPKGLVDELALTADDTGWHHGTGAEVTGPAASLILAISGRPGSIEELTGDGVATLRARLAR